ncbi:MAG: DNA-formamidopyrimidine glycosylase [Bernardetiaceae bacterium]|jgi:formamidopyrimidine-DNA glycosylase|nr:DNA-formamidopyrimidine glycosylase [Bernardetiaceae bacterium]
MPELPEVESYRRYFEATALHQTVREVEVLDSKVVKVDPDYLRQQLVGQRFTGTDRIGKYLFVHLSSGRVLLLHFGMTGELAHYAPTAELPRFTRVRFGLANGYHLAFVDPRKFGRIELGDSVPQFQAAKGLSADALKLPLDNFKAALAKRMAPIKSVLLDQAVAAGVGNWIADEMLFQARVHPLRRAAHLTQAETAGLHQVMLHILELAVAHEAYYRDFPPYFLLHSRGWTDAPIAPCPGCAGEVAKTEVGGRATYFCPRCQPTAP